jgi:hypothetical protein
LLLRRLAGRPFCCRDWHHAVGAALAWTDGHGMEPIIGGIPAT